MSEGLLNTILGLPEPLYRLGLVFVAAWVWRIDRRLILLLELASRNISRP